MDIQMTIISVMVHIPQDEIPVQQASPPPPPPPPLTKSMCKP